MEFNNNNPLTMKKLYEMIMESDAQIAELNTRFGDSIKSINKDMITKGDLDIFKYQLKMRDDRVDAKINDVNKILRQHSDQLFKHDESIENVITEMDNISEDAQEDRETIDYLKEKVADSDLRIRHKIKNMIKSGYTVDEVADALDLHRSEVTSVIADDDIEEESKEGQYWWIPKKMHNEFVKVAKVNNIQDHVDYDEDEEEDVVNHPSHYTDGKYEVIDFIEQYQLSYHAGNAVKYISRAGKKDEDKFMEDLKKAEWYLFRYHNYILSKSDHCVLTGHPYRDRIDVADYCKDKKLGYELTAVINFIAMGEIYNAYLTLHSYIGYCEELGHE